MRPIRTYIPLIRFAALGVCLFFAACGPFGEEPDSRRYRLLWSGPDGAARFQTIEIKDGFDRQSLQGPTARIELDPRLKDGEIVAERPIGRWAQADGVWHPSDLVSLQAGTIYAHLSRVRELSRMSGMATDRLGPLRVGMMTRLGIKRDGFDQRSLLMNNALYDVLRDRIFFVPFTTRADVLPIQLNGGVIAHEYFHRIFAEAVLLKLGSARSRRSSAKGLESAFQAHGLQFGSELHFSHDCNHGISQLKPDRNVAGQGPQTVSLASGPIDRERSKAARDLQYWVFLRAINEGLADYFAWAYLGDAKFVSRSLLNRDLSESRDLSLEPRRFMTAMQSEQLFESVITPVERSLDGIQRWSVPDDMLFGYPYEVGTNYARTLFQFTLGLKVFLQATESSLSDDQASAKALSVVMESVASSFSKMPELLERIRVSGGTSQLLLEPIVLSALSLALQRSGELSATANVKKRSDLPKPEEQAAFRTLCTQMSELNVPGEKWAVCE